MDERDLKVAHDLVDEMAKDLAFIAKRTLTPSTEAVLPVHRACRDKIAAALARARAEG